VGAVCIPRNIINILVNHPAMGNDISDDASLTGNDPVVNSLKWHYEVSAPIKCH
jgi:hypothetical protein